MISFLLIFNLVNILVFEAHGKIIDINSYPWLALIEYPKGDTIKLYCAGSLISDQYVLTAAQCVALSFVKVTPPRNVRLGEYDVTNDVNQPDCATSVEDTYECTDGALVIPIKKIIVHPDYNSITHKDDIALLRMSKSVIGISYFIRPISLPTSDITLSPPSGRQLIEAGWGGHAILTSSKTFRMDVNLPFVSRSECQAPYASGNRKFNITQNHICAAGHGDCPGEAGAPLMWENPNENKSIEIVGIVSVGESPCGNKRPSVYTNVYEYNSWIRQTMKS